MRKSTRAYIYDKQNLQQACYVSYRGKSKRQRQKPEVRVIMDDIPTFADTKMSQIRSGTYQVGAYRHFPLRDRKKIRPISVLPQDDRCVQNLYKGAFEPLVLRQVTDDMCAGLPGRGVTARDPRWSVVSKMKRAIRSSGCVYIWQGDISKYYDNVRNVIAMRFIEGIIHDPVVLGLFRQHLMQMRTLAIGDPWSHLIASLYMAPLVRYLKQNGANLINFADDFFCWATTKEELWRIRRLAQDFAIRTLRLHFKPSQIRRMDSAPVRFCGFVFFPNGKVFLTSDTKKRYVRTRHRSRSVASYNGMLSVCNSRHLRYKVEYHDNNRHVA